MNGFRITNINFSQSVTLPPGTYTYSCNGVKPVGSQLTFMVGTQSFVIENLIAGVFQTGFKKTFTIESEASLFYPARTVGDIVYEPQLETGTNASDPGPNPLDIDEKIESAGLEITSEVARIYATKADVSSEILVAANSITSQVRDVEGRLSSSEQTLYGFINIVSDHTDQLSQFQQTIDQIYLAIEDMGSGEFASILARLDGIDLKVGNVEGILSQITLSNGVVSISAKDHIKMEGYTTINGNFKVLLNGSIEATDGIFTGQINAISGRIGSLRISGSSLTNIGFDDDAYIILRNDPYGTFVGIGGNVLPSSSGLIAVGRFENRNMNGFYGSVNYGILVEASGALRNVGINCIGDIIVKGSVLSLEPVFVTKGGVNAIYDNINKYRRFLFTPLTGEYLAISVPSYSQIMSAFGYAGIPSEWSMEIEISVSYNAGGAIAVRGQTGGIIVDNDGAIASKGGDTYTYGVVRMAKGDILGIRYHSYDQRWVIIRYQS